MNAQQVVEVMTAAARNRSGAPGVIPRALALGEATPSAEPLVVRVRRAANGARRSFWQEMYLELRRHAGSDRLPVDFRGSVRNLAQRAYARAARSADASVIRLPRRLLREPVATRLPESLARRARQEAAAAGIDPEAPMVALELRNRPDVFAGAIALLASRGLTIVRVGPDHMSPLLELFIVSRAQFVVGGSDLQSLSYLVNRPSLAVNGTDPFTLYPIRTTGLYLLRAAIDLETGRELTLSDMLSDSYFRNLRHHGYREHAAADVTAAVAEMLDGVEGGWRDTAAQSRYRARLAEAGTRLGASVRHVVKWGPDDGFLGDGRLARVQAERLS